MASLAPQSQDTPLETSNQNHVLVVYVSTGEEKLHEVTDDPLPSQLRALLDDFGLGIDESSGEEDDTINEGPTYFLTSGREPSTLISTVMDLRIALITGTTVGLWTGLHLVEAALDMLSRDVLESLDLILRLCRDSAGLAKLFIELDVQFILVGVIGRAFEVEDSAQVVEQAMAVMCDLTQYEAGLDAVHSLQEDGMMSANFFRNVVSSMLAPTDDRMRKSASIREVEAVPPFNALCGCLFLLEEIPQCARATHGGIYGDAFDTPLPSLYPELADALRDDLEFRRVAAYTLLSGLLISARNLAEEGDQALLGHIRECLVKFDGASGDVDSSVLDHVTNVEGHTAHVVASFMMANAELAEARLKLRQGGTALALHKIRKLETKVEHLNETNDILVGKYQKLHSAVAALAPFVKVDIDQTVQDSMRSMLRLGWDSLYFENGYTTLHYAAECVNSPTIIDMLFHFASDADKPDDSGMRPWDYAVKSGNEAVIARLEELRGAAARKRAVSEMTTDPVTLSRTHQMDLLERLSVMEGLPPELSTVLQHTLETGFSNIEWSHDFTALHLAAKYGHANAVRLLIASGADCLATQLDKHGFSPLDYATSGGHEEVVAVLQANMQQSTMKKQQRSGAGMPSGAAETDATIDCTPYPENGVADDGQVLPSAQVPPTRPPGAKPGEWWPWDGQQALGQPTSPPPKTGSPTSPPPKSVSPPKSSPISPQTLPPATDVERLSPKMQKALGAVVDRGWHAIVWPNDFTALHLAAQLGSVPATKELLKAGAHVSLAKPDKHGKRPIDYALDSRHTSEELLSLLKPPEQSEAAPEQTLGEKPVEGADGKAHQDNMLPEQTAKRQSVQGGDAEKAKVLKLEADLVRLQQLHDDVVSQRDKLAEKTEELAVEAEKAAKTSIGATPLGGPLCEEDYQKCLKLLEDSGEDAVIQLLEKPNEEGGFSLDTQAAQSTAEKLQVLRRFCDASRAAVVSTGKGQGDAGKGQTSTGKGQTDTGKGQISGKAGSKGKSPQGPPPKAGAPDTKLSPDAAKGASEEKGKGKGSSKGKTKGSGIPSAKAAKAKGAAAKAIPKNKPEIKPKAAMKKFWWVDPSKAVPVFGGKELPLGSEGIWKHVADDTGLMSPAEFEELFAAGSAKKEQVAAPKEAGPAKKKEKPLAVLRVEQDHNKILVLDGHLKTLMYPEVSGTAGGPLALTVKEVVEAFVQLDGKVLGARQVEAIRSGLIPTQEQLDKLLALRKEHKGVPYGLPEQLMLVIGNVPLAQQKADCWHFCLSAAENVHFVMDNLKNFEMLSDSIMNSEGVRSLFGILLAVGNYLNGGTKYGQADGFASDHVLGMCYAFRDNKSQPLTRFVLDTFYKTKPEMYQKCIEDLRPCFRSVTRSYVTRDGMVAVQKKCKLVVDDWNNIINGIKKDRDTAKPKFIKLMSTIKDPADQTKLRLPALFETASGNVDRMMTTWETCLKKFESLKNYLKIKDAQFSPDALCLMWDDFFVPKDKVEGMNVAQRAKTATPAFFSNKDCSSDDILIFWGLKEPEQEPRYKRVKDQPHRKRGAVPPLSKRGEQANVGRMMLTVADIQKKTAALRSARTQNSLKPQSSFKPQNSFKPENSFKPGRPQEHAQRDQTSQRAVQ